MYNGGEVSPIEIAKIGQYAENVYFGKPCGLMDQMACSVGSLIHIDFARPGIPDMWNRLKFDMEYSMDIGYVLQIRKALTCRFDPTTMQQFHRK